MAELADNRAPDSQDQFPRQPPAQCTSRTPPTSCACGPPTASSYRELALSFCVAFLRACAPLPSWHDRPLPHASFTLRHLGASVHAPRDSYRVACDDALYRPYPSPPQAYVLTFRPCGEFFYFRREDPHLDCQNSGHSPQNRPLHHFSPTISPFLRLASSILLVACAFGPSLGAFSREPPFWPLSHLFWLQPVLCFEHQAPSPRVHSGIYALPPPSCGGPREPCAHHRALSPRLPPGICASRLTSDGAPPLQQAHAAPAQTLYATCLTDAYAHALRELAGPRPPLWSPFHVRPYQALPAACEPP